MHEGNNL